MGTPQIDGLPTRLARVIYAVFGQAKVPGPSGRGLLCLGSQAWGGYAGLELVQLGLAAGEEAARKSYRY